MPRRRGYQFPTGRLTAGELIRGQWSLLCFMVWWVVFMDSPHIRTPQCKDDDDGGICYRRGCQDKPLKLCAPTLRESLFHALAAAGTWLCLQHLELDSLPWYYAFCAAHLSSLLADPPPFLPPSALLLLLLLPLYLLLLALYLALLTTAPLAAALLPAYIVLGAPAALTWAAALVLLPPARRAQLSPAWLVPPTLALAALGPAVLVGIAAAALLAHGVGALRTAEDAREAKVVACAKRRVGEAVGDKLVEVCVEHARDGGKDGKCAGPWS
ncbi:hypothetical protein JCM10449v2_006590 [Rhodotorula kratochvilovae]